MNSFSVWVGFRYLKSKKSSRFLSFITVLSVLGIGLGVLAMLVVLSVMDGFETQMKSRLLATDAHILITPTRSVPGFAGGVVPQGSLDRVKNLLGDNRDVDSISPVLQTEVIFRSGRKIMGVVYKGVTAERLEAMKSQIVESASSQMLFDRESHQGSSRFPGVFVGQELAYEMALIPGDFVTLISPTETEGPISGVPRLKRFVIEGIFQSGMPNQELHTVYSVVDDVRSFMHKADGVNQWEVMLHDYSGAPALAAQIREAAPEFQVRDWMELNSSLFFSLKLERFAMFIVLAFIVVVASFNIVTTLTLMVLEKRREIAILKTMGATHEQVGAIFLSEGLLIGGVGVLGGTLLAYFVCFALRHWEFVTLPDIYYDRTLPVTFNPYYYAGVAIAALVIVLTACIYPSRRAARLQPLDGIRD